MTLLIILVVIAFLAIIMLNNSSKPEVKRTFEETTKPIHQEYTSIDDEIHFEHFDQFELKGVHIEPRKTYILSNVAEMDEVFLIHEVKNPYSAHAIAVMHNDNLIGYMPDESGPMLIKIIKKGYNARISDIYFDGSYISVTMSLDY